MEMRKCSMCGCVKEADTELSISFQKISLACWHGKTDENDDTGLAAWLRKGKLMTHGHGEMEKERER